VGRPGGKLAARRRFDALAIGDAILDVVNDPVPARGSGDGQSRVDSITYLPGGNATNFALALARLGGRAAFVGSVGRDAGARVLRDAYRAAGVAARLRTTAGPTGTTMAVTYEGGRRHLITALGANGNLRPSDAPPRWIASASHVHRAGYWWTPRLQGPPTLRLLRSAHARGATTSLDIATDPEGWTPSRRDSVRTVLPEVDVFFGNEEETLRTGARPDVEASAEVLLDLGVREVVVHLGPRGSLAVTRERSFRSAPFRAKARNPTGCGDVFNAAYVLASLHGADVASRLRIANAAGAWHLEHPDAPYPSRRDLARRFGSRAARILSSTR